MIAATPTWAQFDVLTCSPYIHGELKKSVPTFFCAKKADAQSYIDIMEKRRLNKISQQESRKALSEFRKSRECFYITTSHISQRTLHQGAEAATYCKAIGFESTKWPSLIEAQLTGDKSLIWILTHAIVPPVE